MGASDAGRRTTSDVVQGDCREVLASLPANFADAIVTDPPYGIGFMGKEWDTFKPGKERERVVENRDREETDNPNVKGRKRSPATSPSAVEYDRSLAGQVGFQDWTESWAREAFRVLKPGGYLLVCGAPRSYHRMACGIENAGFEIRDTLAWMFGQGFPKSLDVSKAMDKAAGASRAVLGPRQYADGTQGHWGVSDKYAQDTHTKSLVKGTAKFETAPATDEAAEWEGWGTALKPAYEPIVMARKPLAGTVVQNIREYGTGAINVDGCRIATIESLRGGAYSGGGRPSSAMGCTGEVGGKSSMLEAGGGRLHPMDFQQPEGRWPANLLHDGSAEALAAFPAAGGAQSPVRGTEPSSKTSGIYADFAGRAPSDQRDGGGSAARFFYQAKTSTGERNYGCDILPATSAGEMTGGRKEGGAGLKNPRAGAGRTGRLYSYGKVLYPSASWVNAVLARRLPAATVQSLAATVGSTIRDSDGCAWSMCWCGSPSTDLSRPAIRSIIATESSWTTDRTISNSSPRPHTNGCMAAAFGAKALGGNPVGFAESSSPSDENSGTSAPKGGRATAGVVPAISVESWLTSKPEDVGGVRLGNAAGHPTVKPIRLMRYLCRLVTPPGGLIIDPFLGSGTTGIAADLEGFSFLGIEQDPQWVRLAETRIAAWMCRADADAVTRP